MSGAALSGRLSNPPSSILSKSIKILAIDTSTDACSVALSIQGYIEEQFVLAPRTHTHLVLPMIDALLKKADLTLSEIEVFAFGRGPGSFTGVRITSSIIQALGFGLNKPIIPVSTLRALAQAAYQEQGARRVLAYLDARMQEIYWGLFEIDVEGIMQPVLEERVQSPKEINYPVGDFLQVTGYPHAKEIARIAAADYSLGHVVSAKDAVPVYLRDKVVWLQK